MSSKRLWIIVSAVILLALVAAASFSMTGIAGFYHSTATLSNSQLASTLDILLQRTATVMP